MHAEFGSSGTYRGMRRNFFSKPTPIHVPGYKSEFNLSYSIIHFSLLPQAVSKILVNGLSHKVSYASMLIDTVSNGFISN